ncbi:MAG: hypothetical protein KTR31_34420 [Myxococcales bacterium]|nr:hypothetical protein [Myxococcales bacterium]
MPLMKRALAHGLLEQALNNGGEIFVSGPCRLGALEEALDATTRLLEGLEHAGALDQPMGMHQHTIQCHEL